MARSRKKKPDALKPAAIAEPLKKRDRLDRRWYARPDKPHDAVRKIVETLMGSSYRSDLQLWQALYLDRKREDAAARRWSLMRPEMRARMNIIRNGVETLLAMVGKHQPRLMVTTVGADWELQKRAKKLQRYVDGDWERLRMARLRRDVIHDALIYGQGCLKVVPGDDNVEAHRVWCGNVLHHPREDAADCIRTEYEICFVDREVLWERWPEHRKAIDNLGSVERNWLTYDGAEAEDDLAIMIEAWHLPTHKDDKGEWQGGRHVMCIDGATLLDDPWKRDSFPIVKMYATRDPSSTRGVGYPERMAGAQAEQNHLAETASEVALKMRPKYVTTRGSQIDVEVLSNEIEVWQCSGDQPPIVLSAEPILLQLMQAASMQRAEAYRIEGIGEDMAEGSSPDNLDSGKAKLVHRDIQATRHVDLHQRVEDLTVDLGWQYFAALDELADDNVPLKALAKGKRGKTLMEELNYEDVRMGDSPFALRVFPVSNLSNTPEGRMADVERLLKAQLIPIDVAMELLDLPDTERANDEAFARRDFARQLIEQAMDGERTRPEKVPADLSYVVTHGPIAYSLARQAGATERDLVHLDRLIAASQAILDSEAAKAAQPPAGASIPPPALPPAGPPMPPVPAPPPVMPTGPIGIVQ